MILEAIGSFALSMAITLAIKNFTKDDDKMAETILQVLEANNINVKCCDTIYKPKIVKVEPFKTFVRYFLLLPNGISTQKVKGLSESLSEGLKREITISYDFYTIIDVYNNKLPQKISFDEEMINKNDYKVPLGLNMKREIVTLNFTGPFSHLIIAGISGSGKSVLVHLILTVLSLKEKKPDLYLCDLKFGVELAQFEHMEHVKGFATTLDDLNNMLDIVIEEMKRRYIKMKELGIKTWKGTPLILLLDEMIDLKMSNSDTKSKKKLKASINEKLMEINAKGRAARVYDIMATQRPDKDVINGLIKTNVGNTVGYKTRDDTQSRIILDNNLSAQLDYIPGRGYFQTSEDVLMQTFYLNDEKEAELLKDIPRVIKHEQTTTETRQMDTNIIDLEQVGFFDDNTGDKVISFERAKRKANS